MHHGDSREVLRTIAGNSLDSCVTDPPDVMVWHTPNGELRNKRHAAKLKAMGVRPGVFDLALIDPNGRLCFLEVNARTGTLSTAQKAFRDQLIPRGIPFAVVHDIDEAREALRYFNIGTRESA